MDHGRVIFDGDTETAISIYMQNNAEMKLSYDCSGERPYQDLDERVRLDRVEFLNKSESPIYCGSEKIQIGVQFTAAADTAGLAMRIILQTRDRTRVGMTTTAPIRTGSGCHYLTAEFPIDWLSPGRYSCFIVFYSVNEFGTTATHDRVDNVCLFEKVSSVDENNRMEWSHAAWGHMMLPEVQILSQN